jgi:hypothetical protein
MGMTSPGRRRLFHPALRTWVLGIQELSVHKGTADVTNMIGVAPR